MGEDDFNGSLRVFVGNDDSSPKACCQPLFAVRFEARPEGRDVAGFVGDGLDRQIADG